MWFIVKISLHDTIEALFFSSGGGGGAFLSEAFDEGLTETGKAHLGSKLSSQRFCPNIALLLHRMRQCSNK